MAPDNHVVTNLYLVVDLRSLANHGVPIGSAVDRGIRTDFNIVLYDNASDLRNFQMSLWSHRVTEAILTAANTGMETDTVSQNGVLDRAIRPDNTVAADLDTPPDNSVRSNYGARPDFNIGTYDSTRFNGDIFFKNCGRINNCTFGNT